VSAFTTNDTTAPSATNVLGLATTTSISFALMTFVNGSSASFVNNSAATAVCFYTFIDCTFNACVAGSQNYISLLASSTGLALCVIVDRCTGIGAPTTGSITFNLPSTASGSGDYDALVYIRNTFTMAQNANGVRVTASAANANHGGGVRAYNCTLFGSPGAFQCVTATTLSTTIPCEVHNSLCVSGATVLSAATSGQLVESNNILLGSTPRTNVTAGTGSQTTAYAPLLELGQSFKWAMGTVRQFMAPDGASSPLLGFGSSNAPPVDWFNRPRPSGGKSPNNAVGFAEFHDFGIQDTSVFPSGQTSSAKLIGPGDNDIWVPVDAVSTTIAIQLNQATGYGGSVYATATLEANGELGIPAQVQTCSSTLNSWQTLTFSAISASKAGWVRIRISSFDTSGTAALNFGALVAT
jgi:hypothetical protein